MKIMLYDKKKTDALKPVIDVMYAGLKKTGFDVIINTDFNNAKEYDIAVCWGWRKGKKEFEKGKQVLVMEHGYMIDRNKWISLGWNGLNNDADFLNKNVLSDRWDVIFKHHMKSWKKEGEYILFCGQVPGDMSLKGKILSDWYISTAHKASNFFELPVVWRPHPLDKHGTNIIIPNAKTDTNKNIVKSLEKAAAIMAFNSNSLINGVMEGVPAIAFDQGTMVWDICSHKLEKIKTPCREDWGRKMGYTQWNHEEIANGTAIKHIFKKYLQ
jgi:hypothetical protein